MECELPLLQRTLERISKPRKQPRATGDEKHWHVQGHFSHICLVETHVAFDLFADRNARIESLCSYWKAIQLKSLKQPNGSSWYFLPTFCLSCNYPFKITFQNSKDAEDQGSISDMKMWNVLLWYVIMVNLNMDQSTTCLHLVLSFFYAGFSTWTCARRCARCTQLQWWDQLSVLDFRWCIRLAGCLVGRWFNHQLVGYKWWQVKSEFHRHVSVSQNEGLKDPVKIWQ